MFRVLPLMPLSWKAVRIIIRKVNSWKPVRIIIRKVNSDGGDEVQNIELFEREQLSVFIL